MYVVSLKSNDPQFNLATEEYFLKHTPFDFFILWRNAPSVIIGRNQNAYAEINLDFVKEKNIPVVRRLTGGGAVFHDLGNLNYTFIESDASDKFGNYEVFSKPVIDAIRTLGAKVVLKGRNDLVIDDKKVSGNAQTLYHGRMMHHGTLLFSADFSDLTAALKVNPLKIQSKGIKSIKSRVANIKDYIDSDIDVLQFRDVILEHALADSENQMYELTKTDLEKIQELYDEKYSTDEWNFGFAKQFTVTNEKRFDGGIVSVNLDIEDDYICSAKIYGDFFGILEISEFEKMLVGKKYTPNEIEHFINTINISKYFSSISANEILTVLF